MHFDDGYPARALAPSIVRMIRSNPSPLLTDMKVISLRGDGWCARNLGLCNTVLDLRVERQQAPLRWIRLEEGVFRFAQYDGNLKLRSARLLARATRIERRSVCKGVRARSGRPPATRLLRRGSRGT